MKTTIDLAATKNNLFAEIRAMRDRLDALERASYGITINNLSIPGGGIRVGDIGVPTAQDVRAVGDIVAGSGLGAGDIDAEPTDGDVFYTGDLTSVKGGVNYPVWGFVPLNGAAGSTYWGGPFSTQAKTLLDMSADYSSVLPSDTSHIKAYYFTHSMTDSGSFSGGLAHIILSNNATAGSGLRYGPEGRADNTPERGDAIVPTTASGDIYVELATTGTNTAYIYLALRGYFI